MAFLVVDLRVIFSLNPVFQPTNWHKFGVLQVLSERNMLENTYWGLTKRLSYCLCVLCVRVFFCWFCCVSLLDTTKDGQLDLREFAIAMHLIKQARSGAPIPATLPAELSQQNGASVCMRNR